MNSKHITPRTIEVQPAHAPTQAQQQAQRIALFLRSTGNVEEPALALVDSDRAWMYTPWSLVH
jgi:hypothetical protein